MKIIKEFHPGQAESDSTWDTKGLILTQEGLGPKLLVARDREGRLELRDPQQVIRPNLNKIKNVSITQPKEGDVLVYRDSIWKNVPNIKLKEGQNGLMSKIPSKPKSSHGTITLENLNLKPGESIKRRVLYPHDKNSHVFITILETKPFEPLFAAVVDVDETGFTLNLSTPAENRFTLGSTNVSFFIPPSK